MGGSMDHGKNILSRLVERFRGSPTISLVFSALMLIVLFLIPRPNVVPHFQVNAVSVDNFFVSVSTPQLTGDWNISLTTKNPNKDHLIVYNNVDAVLSYKKEFISGAVIKPFEQIELEETLMKARISILSASISNKIAGGIEEEFIGRRVVEFEVMIQTRVDINSRMISEDTAMRFKIRALCENLKVEFPSNATVGVMLQSPPPCKVRSRRL